MLEEPIEEAYFNWLCAKVISVNSQNYWGLMRILHKTEFTWIIRGDRNRAEDGIELRLDFFRERFIKKDPELLDQPCSVLEMFIAFSRRANFQIENLTAQEWFWQFMNNLHLDEYQRVSKRDEPEIEDILYRFIDRKYKYNGYGGMFPLRKPERDQREVEVWYQFCDYLEDHGLLYELL